MCGKLNYLICFVLLLALMGVSVAQEVDPNLVGWWKLDEGTGQLAYDETAYWNDGVLNGGPLWIDGRIGGALDFDGTDDYINCGKNDSLNITGEINVGLWITTD